MSQIWHFVKLAASVLCGFAALVCLILGVMTYVIPLSVTSLAFSQMPE